MASVQTFSYSSSRVNVSGSTDVSVDIESSSVECSQQNVIADGRVLPRRLRSCVEFSHLLTRPLAQRGSHGAALIGLRSRGILRDDQDQHDEHPHHAEAAASLGRAPHAKRRPWSSVASPQSGRGRHAPLSSLLCPRLFYRSNMTLKCRLLDKRLFSTVYMKVELRG